MSLSHHDARTASLTAALHRIENTWSPGVSVFDPPTTDALVAALVPLSPQRAAWLHDQITTAWRGAPPDAACPLETAHTALLALLALSVDPCSTASLHDLLAEVAAFNARADDMPKPH